MNAAHTPFLRSTFERWLRARSPRQPAPVILTRRRIFILPTRFGYGYVALLVVMLLGAINYGNSMAFALTFLLTGIGFVAMYHTHGNLANLALAAHAARAVFAGQPVAFELTLTNASRLTRYTLRAGWPRGALEAPVDVPANSSTVTRLRLPTTQRGWLPLPRFIVTSEFPLGLFHAWAWIDIDTRVLIYPQPLGNAALASTRGAGGTDTSALRPGTDDFAGLRDYRFGDPLRLIHWKSLARATVPLVKEFSDQHHQDVWLDWSALPGLDTEARLSQLTHWLLSAEAQRRAYGLRLPGVTRAPALGGEHRRACLRTLALFGTVPDA